MIDERAFIQAVGRKSKDFSGDLIFKDFNNGMYTYHASNKKRVNDDIVIHGVLNRGKCYTDPLIIPETETYDELTVPIYEEFREEVEKLQ